MSGGAVAIGLAGGVLAGMLGIGGGVLFVPGLVFFLSLSQHQAEATSLLAIVPVAIIGAYQHDRYGNVRRALGAGPFTANSRPRGTRRTGLRSALPCATGF